MAKRSKRRVKQRSKSHQAHVKKKKVAKKRSRRKGKLRRSSKG